MTSPKSMGVMPVVKPDGSMVKVFSRKGTRLMVSTCWSSRIKTTPRIGPTECPQSADDNHADIENRVREAELLGVQGAGPVGQQRAGDTGKETADEEGQQFVIKQVDAHHLGGQVVIPDGDKSPAYLGPGQVLGKKDARGPR